MNNCEHLVGFFYDFLNLARCNSCGAIMTELIPKSSYAFRHGDCLELMKKCPDACFDAIIADPPFGIGYKYNSHKDHTNPSDYFDWLQPRYAEMMRVLKPGGFFAMWQTQKYFKHFWDWFGDDIHIYAGCKNFVQLKKTPINYGYDPIIMFYKQNGKPLKPKKPKRSIDFFVANTAKFVTEKGTFASKHPCPRPIDQATEIITNFTIENALVLDPFIGSGTIAEACLNNGRSCIGFDIDNEYVNLARERIFANCSPPFEASSRRKT